MEYCAGDENFVGIACMAWVWCDLILGVERSGSESYLACGSVGAPLASPAPPAAGGRWDSGVCASPSRASAGRSRTALAQDATARFLLASRSIGGTFLVHCPIQAYTWGYAAPPIPGWYTVLLHSCNPSCKATHLRCSLACHV